MGFRNWLSNLCGNNQRVSTPRPIEINPATGLPMIDGAWGVDVAGNPFGTNLADSTNTVVHTQDFDDSFRNDVHSNGFSDW